MRRSSKAFLSRGQSGRLTRKAGQSPLDSDFWDNLRVRKERGRMAVGAGFLLEVQRWDSMLEQTTDSARF